MHPRRDRSTGKRPHSPGGTPSPVTPIPQSALPCGESARTPGPGPARLLARNRAAGRAGRHSPQPRSGPPVPADPTPTLPLPGPAASSLGARSPLARRLCYPRWKLETARREQSSAEASPAALCASLWAPRRCSGKPQQGDTSESTTALENNNNNNNNLKTPKCRVLLSS